MTNLNVIKTRNGHYKAENVLTGNLEIGETFGFGDFYDRFVELLCDEGRNMSPLELSFKKDTFMREQRLGLMEITVLGGLADVYNTYRSQQEGVVTQDSSEVDRE